jgi:Alpha/beta hydrolase family
MIQNNTWINQSDSRTVIIFVHGILSNSDSCWRNTKTKTYWPNLVQKDLEFEDAAVFVGGYATSPGVGLYDVRAAADGLLAVLRTPGTRAAPLDKDRLLFVCHSQGGIVVRQMLYSHSKSFRSKRVGVVLCGSPSWGSFYATLLAPIALLIRFRQLSALSWGGSTLRNLDRDFLQLLDEKRIPDLSGICLAETKGRFLGIPFPKIVAEPSATRYFPWHPIPAATHTSLVKPPSTSHLSHVHLRDFAHTKGLLTRKSFQSALADLLVSMKEVLDAYSPTRPLGTKGKTERLERLFTNVRRTLDQSDRSEIFARIPLGKLLTANLDGTQHWAFYDFSRDEYLQLYNSLNQLSRS